MEEIEKCIRMTEKSLAMTTPLLNHLDFDGMTKYVNGILLGMGA